MQHYGIPPGSSPFVRYAVQVGYSRRKEESEIVAAIHASNQRIAGITLGQLCAQGMLRLEVKCWQCQRKGRYGLLRLIAKHGAMLPLTKLAEILSADCPNRQGNSYFLRCGIYFPDVKPSLPLPEKPLR